MESLKTVQVFAKIGKILSQIVFVCCIIGVAGCVLALILLPIGAQLLDIEGATLNDYLIAYEGYSLDTLYATIASAMVIVAGECVTAKFAQLYFKRELKDGTPFTLRGAKEMLRLGIISVAVSVGSVIIAAIVKSVMAAALPAVQLENVGDYEMSFYGLLFIVVSFVLRSATEFIAAKQKGENESGSAELDGETQTFCQSEVAFEVKNDETN